MYLLRRLLPLLLLLVAPAVALAETGTAVVLHADRGDGTALFETWAARDTGGRVFIASGRAPYRTDIQDGDRVWLTRVAPTLAATKGAKAATPASQWAIQPLMGRRSLAAAPAVSAQGGTQTVLFMLIDYTDKAHALRNTSSLTPIAQQTVDYYTTASYGALNLVIDAVGPLRIQSVTPQSGACDSSRIADLADTAARAAGVDLGLYMRKVYFLPQSPGCSAWAGLGTIGGNPSRAWLNGTTFFPIVIHELGHNVGLYHSHALYCTAQTGAGTGMPLAKSLSLCNVQEYGDAMDVMGDAGGLGQLNAAQKLRLGWATPTNATAGGTYTLTPFESSPSALVIDRAGTADRFTLEHRAVPLRDDSAGVLVHLAGSSPNAIYLLDMTPTEVLTKHAMVAGQTWIDPVSGVRVTVRSTTAAGSTVEVGSGAPPPPPPPADRDGDGVPDALDKCPDVAGIPPTGCPVTPPPPPIGIVLALVKLSAPGREMTFSGTLTGATTLDASVDAVPIVGRYVTVDVKRKTWSAKARSLLKGVHTFTASVPGTTATVSVTFTVPK